MCKAVVKLFYVIPFMLIASEEYYIGLVLDAEPTVDLFIPLDGERYFFYYTLLKRQKYNISKVYAPHAPFIKHFHYIFKTEKQSSCFFRQY